MTMFVGFVNGHLGNAWPKKNVYWKSFLYIFYLGLRTDQHLTRLSTWERCEHETPKLISNFISNMI